MHFVARRTVLLFCSICSMFKIQKSNKQLYFMHARKVRRRKQLKINGAPQNSRPKCMGNLLGLKCGRKTPANFPACRTPHSSPKHSPAHQTMRLVLFTVAQM
jgi:hypothetical protein